MVCNFMLSVVQSVISSCYGLMRTVTVWWPEESKIVEPKEPSAGENVRVKEGTKVYSGKVVAVGSKSEVEE